MIGAQRYDAILSQYGGVDPWLAFNKDGSLRSVKKIKGEKSDGDSMRFAYDHRAAVLTGRYFQQFAIDSPVQAPVSPQSALGAGIAQRVLARADLPKDLTPEQARDYIARRVPAAQKGRGQPSPQKTVQAIQQAVAAWAQAAAYSPQVSHDVLRDAIWRIIRRPEPARPMTYVARQTLPDDLRQRLDAAIEWVRWVVPDRELKPVRVYINQNQGYYQPRTDEIFIRPNMPVHRIVHELLHRVDYLYSGGRFGFGETYAKTMLSQRIKIVDGDVFRLRKDDTPGLYYYQQKGFGDNEGVEFITTMGEQLIANPALAAFGDPKGLELWIKGMRELR